MNIKYLTDLPDDVLIHITKFLPFKELLSLRATCIQIHDLILTREILKRFHIKVTKELSKSRSNHMTNFFAQLDNGKHVKLSFISMDELILDKIVPKMYQVLFRIKKSYDCYTTLLKFALHLLIYFSYSTFCLK